MKQKEIMFAGFGDDFLQDVIKDLQEKEKSICLLFSDKKNESNSLEKIINAEILAREDSIKKYYGTFLDYTLSELELSKLNECRIYFNRTADRIFIKPQSTRSLDSYFHTLLSFWFFVLTKKFKVKSIFFGCSPHFPWDICLFFVAKLLGIKTYIIRRTLIEDCVVFVNDFRYGKSEFIEFDSSFNGLIRVDHILKTYQKESYWLIYNKTMTSGSVPVTDKNRLSNLLGNCRKLNKFLKHFYYELRTSSNTYFRLTKFNYFKFFYKRLKQQRMLLKYWESHCKPFNFKESTPTVYFPMHFQPERSTDPDADHYSQQILAIKLLLKLLPDEWKILVKENPRQNYGGFPNFRRFHYRNISDYRELFNLPRVVPLSVSISSESVLKHCKLIASCTGSVLWEGMLQGKPGISFGSIWHNECKSSPHINDILNDKLPLNILLDKSQDDVATDVQAFLLKNQFSFIHSSNSSQFASQSKVDRNSLIRNLRTAIQTLLEY